MKDISLLLSKPSEELDLGNSSRHFLGVQATLHQFRKSNSSWKRVDLLHVQGAGGLHTSSKPAALNMHRTYNIWSKISGAVINKKDK